MKRRIAILFHENQKRRDLGNYAIRPMADWWQDQGFEVLFLFGTGKSVPADLLLVHVDLSVIPDAYLQYARQYPIALNVHVGDIRKSTISRNLVGPDSGYQGAVVLKTDCNFNGIPERWLTGPLHSRMWFKLYSGISARLTGKSAQYRLYRHATDIPRSFVGTRKFVVEKFLPEMEDGLYCMREYSFFGDKESGRLLKSRLPIVKWSTIVSREPVEPHPEMSRLRGELKFDYGKFDYVIHNGKPVLLDANKTTGFTRGNRSPQDDKALRYLASGIHYYFSREAVGKRSSPRQAGTHGAANRVAPQL